MDDQTSRLDRANDRTADVISIAQACDTRAAQVLTELTPKKSFWHFW